MKGRLKKGVPGSVPVEIFRAGKHTSANGKTLDFSESTLKAIAKAYDPALHEAPIVIGHPKHDSPAFGWIGACQTKGASLFGAARQVHADFAEGVRDGLWKKVSASFYLPDATGNPTPGQFYLRHVGFLGAQPPSVKGLAAVEFSDGEADYVSVDFTEFDPKAFLSSSVDYAEVEAAAEQAAEQVGDQVVAAAQGAVDASLIDKVATAAAAEGVVSAVVEAVLTAAGRVRSPEDAEAMREAVLAAVQGALKSDAVKAALKTALEEDTTEGMQAAVGDAVKAAIEPAIGQAVGAVAEAAAAAAAGEETSADHSEPKTLAERQLAARERKLEARERELRREQNANFLEPLIKQGKRLPAKAPVILDLLEFADSADDSVSFSEPGKTRSYAPGKLVRELLKGLPDTIPLKEFGGGDGTAEFSEESDPADVAKAASAYQAEQHAKGNKITTADAVRHVKGQ